MLLPGRRCPRAAVPEQDDMLQDRNSAAVSAAASVTLEASIHMARAWCYRRAADPGADGSAKQFSLAQVEYLLKQKQKNMRVSHTHHI